jgi:hypothetical protein
VKNNKKYYKKPKIIINKIKTLFNRNGGFNFLAETWCCEGLGCLYGCITGTGSCDPFTCAI